MKRREEFQREKLFSSLAKACAKRPLPIGAIEKTLDEIEATLSELGRAEVTARFIGELVMEKLRDLDRVAYIRFASVYRDFSDIESFKQEVDALLDSGSLVMELTVARRGRSKTARPRASGAGVGQDGEPPNVRRSIRRKRRESRQFDLISQCTHRMFVLLLKGNR